jgi:hypothetical protein
VSLRPRATVLIACAGALFLASPAARADDYQDHADRAEALAKEDRWRDALGELRAALALRPAPRLMYLMAKAQQRLGEARAALSGYESYLAADPGGDEALRRDAQAQIARLRQNLEAPPSWPPPPPPGAPVRFAARVEGDRYHVSSDAEGCDTPCQLRVAPGRQRLSVTGEGTFDLVLKVPRSGGYVSVQNPWNPLVKAGIGLMTAGSVLMIAGTVGVFAGVDDDGDPSTNASRAGIVVGWVIGPIAHLVGIGLLAGGLAKLPESNTVSPVSFDLAPTARGTTARMTFAF